MSDYETKPGDHKGMPPGVPHIIGNEAAERFSFYGMKGILVVFMAQYLHLMNETPGVSMGKRPQLRSITFLISGSTSLR